MGCPKNHKTAWWGLVKYDGPHVERRWVQPWHTEKFAITSFCQLCDRRHYDFGFTWDDMIARGFTADFLKMVATGLWRGMECFEDFQRQKAEAEATTEVTSA
jgi:hypothetical protein